MIIEYDEIYKKWVVWLKNGNIYEELFSSKLKKECKDYIKKNKKAGKKNDERTT